MNILELHTRSRSNHRQSQREGSIALMLILVLTLLLGTFTISATSRISHERQIQWHHRSVATLESAIDSVANSGLTDSAPTENQKIRLPLDDDSDRWVMIEVISLENQPPFYQATLHRNDEPGMFIRRPR